MKKCYWLLLAILLPAIGLTQELSTEETQLYQQIMSYRKQLGLPRIPISPSLNYVAKAHTNDLKKHQPDLGNCNGHSWSSHGNWTACCYTPDHQQATCMWDKPKELTSYPGKGYEISCGSNDCCADFEMTADYALQSWKASAGHNQVMINQGIWKRHNWQAIGISIEGAFAVVWFGDIADN